MGGEFCDATKYENTVGCSIYGDMASVCSNEDDFAEGCSMELYWGDYFYGDCNLIPGPDNVEQGLAKNFT